MSLRQQRGPQTRRSRSVPERAELPAAGSLTAGWRARLARALLTLAAVGAWSGLTGCGDSAPSSQQPRAGAGQRSAPGRANTNGNATRSQASRPSGRPSEGTSTRRPRRRGLGLASDPPGRSATALAAGGSGRMHPPLRPIFQLVDQSRKYAPTLIVWLVDRSPSAEALVTAFRESAHFYYNQPELRELAGEGGAGGEGGADGRDAAEARLLSAVVLFGENVEFAVPPTADGQQVLESLDQLSFDRSGVERPFTAVRDSLKQFLSFRTEQRREVVLIAISDEAGDDLEVLDEIGDLPRRYAIPVHVLGLPAPLGRELAEDQSSETPLDAQVTARASGVRGGRVVRGPESRQPEMIQLDEWRAMGSTVDSGFGPFGWERLCRLSGGRFFMFRESQDYVPGGTGFVEFGQAAGESPDGGEVASPRREGAETNTSGGGGGNWKRSHAPDYVDQAAYEAILDSNPACRALRQAAALGRFRVLEDPRLDFPKRDEASLKRLLDEAQRPAARLQPEIDRLVDTLGVGESGRAQLTRPRWQAAFDLAMGRALAAQVRIEGYNQMLAALERGRNFEQPGSSTWVLQPAAEISTGSRTSNQARRARQYLERVIEQHPGTPWAQLAERELAWPLGWQWTER